MSNPSTIDITRFRMNSHSSIDHYSPLQNEQEQNSTKKEQKNIPLILKKMNSVEKYINEFKTTEMILKQYRPKRQQSPLYDPSLSTSKHLQKLYSQTSQVKFKQEQLKKLQDKCYVKYTSNLAHSTGQRMQTLDDVQSQYVKLKHSINITFANQSNQNQRKTPTPTLRTQYIHSEHKSVTSNVRQSSPHNRSFVNSKSIYLLSKKKKKDNQSDLQNNRINHNDVQKQLKTSFIEENGKKYFADLYLMKRERDKMLKEIFGANEKATAKIRESHYQQSNMKNQSNINNNISPQTTQGYLAKNASYHSNKTSLSTTKSVKKSVKQLNAKQSQRKLPKLKVNLTQLPFTPYEQKMKAEEQSFVQEKILKDRSQKKQKMLKGRNMNWNVYYEMLALKKNQKDKLKSYCKFSQTYADD